MMENIYKAKFYIGSPLNHKKIVSHHITIGGNFV